jgi:hypothetical protein
VELAVRGGLLVRGDGRTGDPADAAHLRSGGSPVLPGSGVAGALRARALRIARVVRARQQDAERWVDRLFGTAARASRLRVSESPLEGGQALRATRVRIDRFTGGVVGGHRFDEEPYYGGAARLLLEVRDPRPGEAGLVLLLLKDLLTGDLPLGGTAGVGRGVAAGRATLHLPGQPAYDFDPARPAAEPARAALNQAVLEFHQAELPAEAT